MSTPDDKVNLIDVNENINNVVGTHENNDKMKFEKVKSFQSESAVGIQQAFKSTSARSRRKSSKNVDLVSHPFSIYALGGKEAFLTACVTKDHLIYHHK